MIDFIYLCSLAPLLTTHFLTDSCLGPQITVSGSLGHVWLNEEIPIAREKLTEVTLKNGRTVWNSMEPSSNPSKRGFPWSHEKLAVFHGPRMHPNVPLGLVFICCGNGKGEFFFTFCFIFLQFSGIFE